MQQITTSFGLRGDGLLEFAPRSWGETFLEGGERTEWLPFLGLEGGVRWGVRLLSGLGICLIGEALQFKDRLLEAARYINNR